MRKIYCEGTLRFNLYNVFVIINLGSFFFNSKLRDLRMKINKKILELAATRGHPAVSTKE